MKSATPQSLTEFVQTHGARVRRREAMALLGIADKRTFKKVVDANPTMKHKLAGEGQGKYLTSVIFGLLPAPSGVRPGQGK